MLYIKKGIIELSTYSFITGKPAPKYIEHIKERITDFKSFEEEV